jgi:protein-disulfide isomerase
MTMCLRDEEAAMPMRIPHAWPNARRKRRRWPLAISVVVLGLIAFSVHSLWNHVPSVEPTTSASTPHPPGPPWRYGNPEARFTIVVYADLECPFCKSYTPVLRQWIDTQADVNMQWHHLPLPMHQPAATQQALWVECVGEIFGQTGFWDSVSWVYAHTRSDGEGLPPGVTYPAQGTSKQQQAVRTCFDGQRPAALVSAQVQEARQAGVDATPTLRLIDHASDRSMMLTGPVVGDALLSAFDWLAGDAPTEPDK